MSEHSGPEIPVAEVQTGSTLGRGRYRLVAPIGRGAAAVVWCAWDQVLHTARALKLSAATEPPVASEAARDLRVEARILAELDHPNIVRVYDVGIERGLSYLVMELLGAATLADQVRMHGPLAPERAADAVRQLAMGLAYAHGRGIVHCDVKPHNALVTADGTVKLGDFGIARMRSHRPSTVGAMGTLGYAAPEVLAESGTIGPAADIYSLGATLYSLATGRDPPSLFAAARQPDLLGGLPHDLERVVRIACSYRPADRYADCASIVRALG